MLRLLILLGLLAAAPISALAGAPGIINSYVGVCDPGSAAHCIAPNADGSINITGAITSTSSEHSTAAAPTYGEGTDNALSGDLSGNLRVIAPLPTGAATSALQTTGNSTLTTINTTLGTPLQNSGGSVTANLGTLNGAATSALQTTGNTALTTINTTLGSPYQAGGALPLPTGAATSALQSTGNTALSTINTTLGTPMQATGGTVGIVAGTAIMGKVGIDQTTDITTNGVEIAPPAGAAAGMAAVVSASLETGHVLKGSAGNLYGVEVVTTTVAGYLEVFNATTVPAAGAVTPVAACYVGAFGTCALNFMPPLVMATGISVAFSASTTPFTKTDSATAFLSGQIK